MTGHAQERSADLLSVEEYAHLRESEEYRSELVRGGLVREPRPGAAHARTQVRLVRRLEAHERARVSVSS